VIAPGRGVTSQTEVDGGQGRPGDLSRWGRKPTQVNMLAIILAAIFSFVGDQGTKRNIALMREN
jgi:hypothetical protein